MDYKFWLVIIFLIFFLLPAVTGRMNGEDNDNDDDDRTGRYSDEDNVFDKDISK